MNTMTRRFDDPDEELTMPLGRFQRVVLGGMTIGRAEYEPGWVWSEHVGRERGQELCEVAHVGLVVTGRNLVTFRDASTLEMGPGDLFDIPPGHDSAVIGDERYVSLHFLGAESYAARR